MDKIQRYTLALIRSALFNAPLDGVEISDSQWYKVFDYVGQQGITAICYDAVMQLPASNRPPRELLLKWALFVEGVEKHYQSRRNTTITLAKELQTIDAKMLVLKGFTISRYYPTPNHRESGDLDIFCFDDFNKVNQLIKNHGIKIDDHNPRHFSFTLNGVFVENHSCFLYNRDDEEREMERFLIESARRYRSENPQQPVLLGDPLANALFFIKHAEKHFVYTMPGRLSLELRSLCDWAMILESGCCDYHKLKELVKGTSVEIFTDLLTYLVVRLLGVRGEWEEYLSPIPEKYLAQGETLITAYKDANEDRHDFFGKVYRFAKYLKYRRFFRFVFDKNIFVQYYSFLQKHK